MSIVDWFNRMPGQDVIGVGGNPPVQLGVFLDAVGFTRGIRKEELSRLIAPLIAHELGHELGLAFSYQQGSISPFESMATGDGSWHNLQTAYDGGAWCWVMEAGDYCRYAINFIADDLRYLQALLPLLPAGNHR